MMEIILKHPDVFGSTVEISQKITQHCLNHLSSIKK